MARSNLAYDLSIYEPKPKAPARPEQAPKPEIKVTKAPAVHQKRRVRPLFITAVVAIVVLFAIISNKIEVNRSFAQLNQLQKELNALQIQNSELASQYQSATALGNVEEYAQDVLGLTKLDKSQVEYVNVEAESVIEVVSPESNDIFVKINNALQDLLEYIGL